MRCGELHALKWVFSDVDICFFNVVRLNAYDIYGVQVVYKAHFFHEDSKSVVVSGWLNLYPPFCG